MMYSKRMLAVVVFAALCAVVFAGGLSVHKAYGFTASGHGGAVHAIEPRFLKFMLGLQLSPSQKQQIASILKSYRQTIGSSALSVAEAKKNLSDAIHSTAYDETKVRQAAKSAAAAEEELAVLRAQVVTQLQGVLSVEQLAAANQFRTDMYTHIKNKMEGIHSIVDLWISSNGG
ncbi:Spy/CpxP family protein refolding chaperone [Candidatus Magnetominusculus xianensis]|uniref:Periplasmic protein n=1 Tax=Candidatus Magnetominusculus xianensis TaxID=1748249 RepID=A0ABR5SIP0_9BACT|nr:periplasmic heavy metal sensor [Candidatus Magnetominusculus xianensis]KWT91082.1 periplasmic protein [Candidatus Magnetominusculus xianensis]